MLAVRYSTGLFGYLLIAAAAPLWGAVPLRLVQGRPVVDGVFVNGHGPYRFLVDTATTANHLEPELARAIGLVATYRAELTSSVGKISAVGSDQVAVELGDARAEGQRFLFAGMEVVHQLAAGIQGILGQEFLSRFDYMLDLRGKRLSFGAQEARGQRAPFRAMNGRAAVATSLGDLVLDSGAIRVILFGVDPEGSGGGYMKTLAGSQLVGMAYRRLAIAGRSVWSGDAVALPNRNEPGVAGLMPVSLFRAVYICNSGSYAVFE
jgi:hypothetical protein